MRPGGRYRPRSLRQTCKVVATSIAGGELAAYQQPAGAGPSDQRLVLSIDRADSLGNPTGKTL
jgi:hypothetical protein